MQEDPTDMDVTEREQRAGTARRRRATRWISRHWLVGRRRGGRRACEGVDQYVDRPRREEWMVVLGIVVLCIADYLLTLEVLEHGGTEINPAMGYLLSKGNRVFALGKIGFTAVGMLFLLIHIRFRRVTTAVHTLLILYCLLMVWHAWVRVEMTTFIQVARAMHRF
jgi:hypothetical protein